MHLKYSLLAVTDDEIKQDRERRVDGNTEKWTEWDIVERNVT